MALPGEVASLIVSGGVPQPAGVDLTASEVFRLSSALRLLRDGKELPEYEPVEARDGFWFLEPGAYKVRFGEVVRVPERAVGLCFPRSSLIRSGVLVACGVWDPGYVGRGEALLAVLNPHGFVLEVGAPIAQIVFFGLWGSTRRRYEGSYQGEGVWRVR